MRIVAIILVSLILVSCHIWPRAATGGYAQHYIFSRKYESQLNKRDDFYKLYTKLSGINRQLIALSKSNLPRCYPAFFRQFHLLLNKAAQEFASGYYHASVKTTQTLSNAVNYIAKRKNKPCSRLNKDFNQIFRIAY